MDRSETITSSKKCTLEGFTLKVLGAHTLLPFLANWNRSQLIGLHILPEFYTIEDKFPLEHSQTKPHVAGSF